MAGASSGSDGLYAVPAIQRPTIEQLRSAAEALHLHISADEMEEYRCRLYFTLHSAQLQLSYVLSLA